MWLDRVKDAIEKTEKDLEELSYSFSQLSGTELDIAEQVYEQVDLENLEDLKYKVLRMGELLEDADNIGGVQVWIDEYDTLNIAPHENHHVTVPDLSIKNTQRYLEKEVSEKKAKQIIKWYVDKL
jgi:hypothetical protein